MLPRVYNREESYILPVLPRVQVPSQLWTLIITLAIVAAMHEKTEYHTGKNFGRSKIYLAGKMLAG